MALNKGGTNEKIHIWFRINVSWLAIDSAGLFDEVRANTYIVNSSEQVYADSATLIIAS